MKRIIENLINGNLADARKGARKANGLKLAIMLRDEYGWSQQKSQLAAKWLKGGDCWQAYCDAA